MIFLFRNVLRYQDEIWCTYCVTLRISWKKFTMSFEPWKCQGEFLDRFEKSKLKKFCLNVQYLYFFYVEVDRDIDLKFGTLVI